MKPSNYFVIIQPKPLPPQTAPITAKSSLAAHAIEAEGKSHLGVLLSTGRTVRLGIAGGQIVEIPEDKITRHETLPVSPMPMCGVLSPQDVADVTVWLLSQKGQNAGAVAPPTAAPSFPAGAGFQFDLRAARLVIGHSGELVAEFVFRDDKILRPYFANVHAPGGLKTTRNHPPIAGVDATDHDTMHPGLWLAFGDISDADFWRNKGRIEQVRFIEPPAVRGEDFRLRFVAVIHSGKEYDAAAACQQFNTPEVPAKSASDRAGLIQPEPRK